MGTLAVASPSGLSSRTSSWRALATKATSTSSTRSTGPDTPSGIGIQPGSLLIGNSGILPPWGPCLPGSLMGLACTLRCTLASSWRCQAPWVARPRRTLLSRTRRAVLALHVPPRLAGPVGGGRKLPSGPAGLDAASQGRGPPARPGPGARAACLGGSRRGKSRASGLQASSAASGGRPTPIPGLAARIHLARRSDLPRGGPYSTFPSQPSKSARWDLQGQGAFPVADPWPRAKEPATPASPLTLQVDLPGPNPPAARIVLALHDLGSAWSGWSLTATTVGGCARPPWLGGQGLPGFCAALLLPLVGLCGGYCGGGPGLPSQVWTGPNPAYWLARPGWSYGHGWTRPGRTARSPALG